MTRIQADEQPNEHRRAVVALIAAFGALGGGYAVYAQAQPSVPQPTITAKPANPTNADFGELQLFRQQVRRQFPMRARRIGVHYM